jgi:hypothetical protein
MALRALPAAFVAAGLAAAALCPAAGGERARGGVDAEEGCLACHRGIEEMHPWKPLACTDCHGGDPRATAKDRAHVAPRQPLPNDERTAPSNHDLAYRRFVNPTDLRVVDRTCGGCHAQVCANVKKSLHATTAGHLSDGLYENGVVASRTQRFAIFPVRDEDGVVPPRAHRALPALPAPVLDDRGSIGAHFTDLPRKACMHCHLWSRGLGVRGRLGQDGWYRSEGCAACHVLYAEDGLSKSGDPTVDRLEAGHPLRHEMTSKIPTETCTRCHALDANIGMSFRGLAQLPPGVPGGPDVPGTTKRLSQGQYFLADPAICPPDVHHERGMHCIDCHDAEDAMGDGNLWGEMEHAVGVSCATCHGTFGARATFETGRGTKLRHLRWEGGVAVLRGKLDGKDRVAKQAADVVTPGHPHHNPRARAAMTEAHARLECYACHSAWSVNFFGFHFDRNESFTQLDLLSGLRTPGRVSTNEKVFASFRHFYLGWNSEGRVAPYMVGFSTLGTVRDAKGRLLLRQELPITAAGLSGMTLVHHQLHTVQPAARRCVECHGAPSVLGCGSENFQLFRDLFVAVGDGGLTVCGFDVKTPAGSRALANAPLPSRPLHVALLNDPLSGRARFAYVACRDGSVQVVDVSDPAAPRRAGAFRAENARRVHVREGALFVAAGSGGLVVASLENPRRPKVVARVATSDARAVHVDGIHAYVADGPGGLRVIDVSSPHAPAVVATVDLNGDDPAPLDANDVIVHYVAARPDVAARTRTRGRNVAFVADGAAALYVVDVTRPRSPEPLRTHGRLGLPGVLAARAAAFSSQYDVGSEGGDLPSAEREYLYLAGTDFRSGQGALLKIDVSVPSAPQLAGRRRTVDDPSAVRIARVYQPPFLKLYALVAGRGEPSIEIADVLGRGELPRAGAVEGAGSCTGLDLEVFPLDRLVGFDGAPLKDVSHEGARLFTRDEIARILRAEVR